MQILFIDESGTPPPVNNVLDSPFFVLGGAIIPDKYWHRVKDDLEYIKCKYNIQGEIKWRFFAPHHKKPHTLSHLDSEQKETLRTELYSVLTRYKSIKIMSAIVDVAAAYQLKYINSPDDLYRYAYKVMTERFQYYLQDISRISGQRINGIIVCDHRAPNEDKRLQELHAELLLGERDAHSSYPNLVEGVFIASSHLSIGIQFADMVAGAVLRYYKSDDSRFYKQIEKTFRKSEKGQLKGYGLIEFPKKRR